MGFKEEEEKRRFIEEQFKRRAVAHERFREMNIYNTTRQRDVSSNETATVLTTETVLTNDDESVNNDFDGSI